MIISQLNLRQLRRKKELTQEALGKAIGVTRQTIIGYENGVEIPEAKQELLQSVLSGVTPTFNTEALPTKIAKGIAYYGDIDVTGGPDELFLDGNVKPSGYIQIPNFEDCDMAFPLFGDSMYPKYKSGQIILCKEFKDWRDYIPFGEVFLVITDSLRTVKYVKKGAKSDLYLLVSENEHFEPFEMPINKVKRMFFVKGAIQRDMM